METKIIFQLILLIILVLLSAFFSSAETAFSCANKIKIKTKADEGNKNAKRVLKILDSYSKLISCILIGNNIVNLSASSLATTLALSTGYSWAVSVATGVLTFVVLMFGEIIPKTIANLKADRMALIYAPFFRLFMIVLTPLVFVIDKFAGLLLLLFGIDKNKRNAITESELRTILDTGHEDGALEEEEREIMDNIMDFGDTVAKDIMIPRIDMTTAEDTVSYKELMSVFKKTMFTRIPIYHETPENIIGIVNIKDFLFVKNPDNFKLSSVIREPYFTYEFKKTSELLSEMRDTSNTITIVLNEYGVAEGMITLEDLLEEIVGEIRDEYDEDEKLLISLQEDGSYRIPGNMKLDDINNSLGTDFESEDYDTIAGLMIEVLDKLPEENESITLPDGTIITAGSISENRVHDVSLMLPTEISEEEPEE